MSITKPKGSAFGVGLCRCCGNLKRCRLLNAEYENSGNKEVYSDMMMDCFGLLLSYMDTKPSDRLVCANCVWRLRDAFSFRKQVLQCEEAFLHMKMDESDSTGNPLSGSIKVEVVKLEPPDPHDDSATADHDVYTEALADACADDDSNDDMPLQQIANNKRPAPLTESEASPVSKSLVSIAAVSKKRRVSQLQPLRNKAQLPSPSPKPVIPISKMQQLIREQDTAYMTDTNIITIVEFSYVCPFKCRHNHLLCYYCGEDMVDAEALRAHTVTKHHPKKFRVTNHKNLIKVDISRIDCRLCAVKIDDLELFKRHIVEVHRKEYYCDQKDLVLPFKLGSDEIKCALCEDKFPYFHALNRHMNEHYSNYVCETCGLGFVNFNRFVMHQARHETGDFPCPDCGKVFKGEYNRDLHIDRVHKKKGRIYCPKCDIRLMTYPQKLKHLITAHGERPMQFPCGACLKVFPTRRTLTIHSRKVHLKDFRYECQICGQKFFTRCSLTSHMPTHTGERNFKCKVCEKSYPRLKTLKDHMRIHNNDRRYRCHVCGQAFVQNCSLKGHLKSQHPEYG